MPSAETFYFGSCIVVIVAALVSKRVWPYLPGLLLLCFMVFTLIQAWQVFVVFVFAMVLAVLVRNALRRSRERVRKDQYTT